MTTHSLNLSVVHSSWRPFIEHALTKVDPSYIEQLTFSKNWLPGPENIFRAFSIPLESVKYVLFGESPYPRKDSANGYAFWDANVKDLWSETGLNKKVNRATSLRNILKMLLVAEGILDQTHLGQDDIARLNKHNLVQTNDEFFGNLLNHGFLLLNASLVLQAHSPVKDAKAWTPFITEIIRQLMTHNPTVRFILFGHIAKKLEKVLITTQVAPLCVEHPYNHSFITNTCVLDFFRPLHLLHKNKTTFIHQ